MFQKINFAIAMAVFCILSFNSLAEASNDMNNAASSLLEISELDSNWARTALPIDSCGFQNMVNEEELTQAPYQGLGGSSQIAFPWKLRFVEFSLKEPQQVERIVLDLIKLERQNSSMETGLENVVICQSDDGKSFKKLPCKVDHLFYRNNLDVYARTTITGDFSGKYFRIYAPWTKAYYVFGSKRIEAALKVFAPERLCLSEVECPLYVRENVFPISFHLDGPEMATGKVELKTVDGSSTILWSQDVTSDMLGRKNILTIEPNRAIPDGVSDLQLIVTQAGHTNQQSVSVRLMCVKNAILLQPKFAGDGWKAVDVVCGPEKKQLLASNGSDAILEYIIPQAGDYGFYLFQTGKSKVHYKINDNSGDIQLMTWHPDDLTDASAGLNFVCCGNFAAGDRMLISASQNSVIGELLAVPMSKEQKKIINKKEGNVPVAILHSDGYSDFFSQDVEPSYLDERIDMAKRGKAFAFDWCIGTTAVNYPSRIASNFGTQEDPIAPREGDRMAIVRLQRLLEQCDPIERLVAKARIEGVRLSITIRANPFYSPINSLLNAQYFIDRPHCLLRRLDGSTGYPQLSYAHEDTRFFFLSVVKEIAAYQPDAIVLEYLRHPPFFGYDEPLIKEFTTRYGSCDKKDFGSPEWQKMCAEIMTDHIRDIRKAIDAINPDISLELNCDWENYYQHGIDLETLLSEGLLDAISPGVYEVGPKKYFPLAPFKTMMAKSPRKVLLIPRVEGTIYGGDPTVAEEKGLEVILRRNMSVNMYKALWLKFRKEGADAIRPFNSGGSWLAAALADQSGLNRFEAFELPLLDFRKKIQLIQE